MGVHRDDQHFVDRVKRATRVTLVDPTSSGHSAGMNASVVQVPTSTSTAVLLAANSDRLTATIVNNANASLSLKYGTGASPSDRTAVISNGQTWTVNMYGGVVTGALSTGTGTASVTEVTP